jgi:hypothetical protein
MSKDHYLGGHTKIFVSKKGTVWDSRWDKNILEHAGQSFERWDTRDKIENDGGVQKEKRRRKQYTYFVLACARAVVEETLSTNFPPAPDFLRRDIKGAGGNLGMVLQKSQSVGTSNTHADAVRISSKHEPQRVGWV